MRINSIVSTRLDPWIAGSIGTVAYFLQEADRLPPEKRLYTLWRREYWPLNHKYPFINQYRSISWLN